MNHDWVAYAGILGFALGILGGYIIKELQDAKHFRELDSIHDEHVELLKTENRKRELLYQGEINRLHCLIAEKAKSTSMSDLVKVALESDGFKEIDFPNGGKR